MIYELRFETKDFTAHDRRDLIDWLQEQNHQNQPTAVQQALRAGGLPLSPSDLPVLFQIIEEEQDQVVRFSYPSMSLEEMVVQIKINTPQVLQKKFFNQSQEETNDLEKHWMMKGVNFLAKKLLKDEFDEFDKELNNKKNHERVGKWVDSWEQNIFGSIVTTLGPLLHEKFGSVQAGFYIEGKRFSVPVNDLIAPQPQQKSPKP